MSSEGAKAFIARWAAASASERANRQPFLCELCGMLGVAKHDAHHQHAHDPAAPAGGPHQQHGQSAVAGRSAFISGG
jgi:hypothetical protein